MAHMTQEEYQQNKKEVYMTTAILSVVTVLEVGLSILFENYIGDPRWILMVFVTLASVVKAYWIMKIFMHVGHEKKGFIFTILFPFVFLVWAILAFSLDGLHYFEMREILNGVFY